MNSGLDLRYWQACFGDYLKITKGFMPETSDSYVRELRRFFEFLERQGITQMGRLTRAHLDGYALHIFQERFRDRPLTRASQKVRLCAIKAFARFLYRENYLLLDIASSFELPRTGRRLPRVILSEKETLRLIDGPDVREPLGLRNRAILELLYGTAIRNTELRVLQLDAVDFERKQVSIYEGKGQKDRVVPLGEEAESWLEEYLLHGRPRLVRSAEQKAVFLSRTGQRLGRQQLAKIVRRLALNASLEKTVTPHTLRHSCATHMLRRGAGIRHLQTLLGHERPDTTMIYTSVEVSDLARMVERFHPREQVRNDV